MVIRLCIYIYCSDGDRRYREIRTLGNFLRSMSGLVDQNITLPTEEGETSTHQNQVTTQPDAQANTVGNNINFGDTGVSNSEALTKQYDRPFRSRISGGLLKGPDNGIINTISKFLGRPYPILTGLFQSTDGPTTFSNSLVLSGTLSNSYYNHKFEGVYAMRATVVLTLQVNSNRFQQGRYILAYVPTGGAGGDSGATANIVLAHRYSKVQITQLPHVELDLATDTQVVLKIPYTNMYTAYPFTSIDTTDYGELGYWFLYPYSPLASASGSNNCGFTVWAHFEDVELFANAVPQSGWEFQSSRGGISTKTAKKTPTEAERDSMNVGPIEGALVKVKTTSDIFSDVPLLSSLSSQVSWIADHMSKAAHVWGWSRPLDLSPVTRVKGTVMPYHASADVVDTAQPLSLISRNEIEPAPGFAGTDLDELSIDYIKSISSWWGTYTWNTTQSSNTSLFTQGLFPQSFVVDSTDGTTSVKSFPPVAFVSSMFELWRGSFIFTFKIVKTEFHSGRLLFCFNPLVNRDTGSPTYTIQNSPFMLREIIDLRYGNEFSFEVPYTSVLPWLYCNTSYVSSMGDISLIILDPLVAPSTVSSSVQILCEVRGGHDMEFALPRAQVGYPAIPYSQQSGWTFQSGIPTIVETNPEVATSGMIGDVQRISDKYADSSICVGEKITSLRQILKYYSSLFPYSSGQFNGVSLELLPSFIGWGVNLSASPFVVPPLTTTDSYTYIGSCYLFHRGSIRYRIWQDTTQNSVYRAWMRYRTSSETFTAPIETSTVTTGMYDRTNVNALSLLALDSQAAGMEVQVPAYHWTHSRVVAGESWQGLGGPTASAYNYSPPVLVVGSGYNTASNWFVARSMGDDGNFGFFISVPPIVNYIS